MDNLKKLEIDIEEKTIKINGKEVSATVDFKLEKQGETITLFVQEKYIGTIIPF